MPLEEPERDDVENAERYGYVPYYLDHDPWHPYEEQDAVGSGEDA